MLPCWRPLHKKNLKKKRPVNACLARWRPPEGLQERPASQGIPWEEDIAHLTPPAPPPVSYPQKADSPTVLGNIIQPLCGHSGG